MKKTLLIARVAMQELIYEKVFYILLGFVVAALGLSLMLGRLTYAQQTKLTLDFIMAGIELSMILFSVFIGIFLLHRELNLGSVSMLLSKPITRSQFLLGKFIGQLSIQTLVIFLMALITYFVCPQDPKYYSFLSVVQACYLIAWEIAVLTAITYFFAINSGAILTALGTLGMFLIGYLMSGSSPSASSSAPYRVISWMVPHFELFNMKSLASYGLMQSWESILWASIYGMCCLGMYLFGALLCFNQKDILT